MTRTSWRVSAQAKGSQLAGCPQEGALFPGGLGPVLPPPPPEAGPALPRTPRPAALHSPASSTDSQFSPHPAFAPPSLFLPKGPGRLTHRLTCPPPISHRGWPPSALLKRVKKNPNIPASVRRVTYGKSIFLREKPRISEKMALKEAIGRFPG